LTSPGRNALTKMLKLLGEERSERGAALQRDFTARRSSVP
jgi:hypothetical protein